MAPVGGGEAEIPGRNCVPGRPASGRIYRCGLGERVCAAVAPRVGDPEAAAFPDACDQATEIPIVRLIKAVKANRANLDMAPSGFRLPPRLNKVKYAPFTS